MAYWSMCCIWRVERGEGGTDMSLGSQDGYISILYPGRLARTTTRDRNLCGIHWSTEEKNSTPGHTSCISDHKGVLRIPAIID